MSKIIFSFLLLVAVVLTGCTAPSTVTVLSADDIKTEIDKANYCNTPDDCGLAGFSKCPFGCYIYVNQKEASRIEGLIEAYEQGPQQGPICMYMCVQSNEVECVNKKCQAIFIM